MVLRGEKPSRGYMPNLLPAEEMTLPRRESFFVFAQHEATHEHGTNHDDKR